MGLLDRLPPIAYLVAGAVLVWKGGGLDGVMLAGGAIVFAIGVVLAFAADEGEP